GRLHAENIARVPGLELVAMADPAPGEGVTVADWRELLDRADVDAVIVGSPSALHAEQIEAFAAAGQHVFCEKPLATDLPAPHRPRRGSVPPAGRTPPPASPAAPRPSGSRSPRAVSAAC